MTLHPNAGTRPNKAEQTNIVALLEAYFSYNPDINDPSQRVIFGTSGHRGSALSSSFNESHILAISQAICEYRIQRGISGPLYLGADTHALSAPAHDTALEVLAANGVNVRIAAPDDYVPTPAVSHAILHHNRFSDKLADGIIITPSHNPPEDGGFKYNPPHGGPADKSITDIIQKRANDILADNLKQVRRISKGSAMASGLVSIHDFRKEYVNALSSVIDIRTIRNSKHSFGVHPLGGAGVNYWQDIVNTYDLPITVIDTTVDKSFSFMTRDWDGAIRMDPSSPYAMASVLENAKKYSVTFVADTDHDRHGIITAKDGLMLPNSYLAVCINYLLKYRDRWKSDLAIGKTVVSSSLIDRVCSMHNRSLFEVPVGFKWFTDGLLDGTLAFVGEESAGSSFLDMSGRAWSTDKDGIIAGLLAAEMTARCGKDPAELLKDITSALGEPVYSRTDAKASTEQKLKLSSLSAKAINSTKLAGDTITEIYTHAPGNGASIGGVKVCTNNGWFAARPSGTEDIYKIYAESFIDKEHLDSIMNEAQIVVHQAIE